MLVNQKNLCFSVICCHGAIQLDLSVGTSVWVNLIICFVCEIC